MPRVHGALSRHIKQGRREALDPSKSIQAPARASVSLPKKVLLKVLFVFYQKYWKKRAFLKAIILLLKTLHANLNFPRAAGDQMQSCILGMVSLAVFSSRNFDILRKKCCCSNFMVELLTTYTQYSGCSAASWFHLGPGLCPASTRGTSCPSWGVSLLWT